MPVLARGPGGGSSSAFLQQAEQFLRLFRGRQDYVGVARGGGFCPEALAGPLSPGRLAAEHLAGERCLGLYLMRLDNSVWCSCLDFDNKPHKPDPAWKSKAERVCRLLAKHGVTPPVEISQSGSAAHVWIFFDKPVPAQLVRAFWRGVLAALDIPVPEIYPRQDKLTGKGLGNLIRYPLWNQSHFVDITAGWIAIPPTQAMSAVAPLTRERLQQVAADIGFSLDPSAHQTRAAKSKSAGAGQPVRRSAAGHQAPGAMAAGAQNQLPARVKELLEHDEYLLDRWAGETDGLADTSRSAVVASLACMLVRRYVPTPEIEAAIRYWCHEHNYDKGNREDWLKAVMDGAYDLIGADCLRGRRHKTARLPEDTPALIRNSFRRTVSGIVARGAQQERRTSR